MRGKVWGEELFLGNPPACLQAFPVIGWLTSSYIILYPDRSK